jgi:AraC family transcriptional activator of pobA
MLNFKSMLKQENVNESITQVWFQELIETPEARLLGQLEQLVELNYKHHYAVPFYANLLGLTAGYLNKICLVYFSCTVHELLQQRLLKESQKLLIGSMMSAKTIAYALGFEDPAYFCRWFKKISGLSPKQYRKQHQKLRFSL